MSEGGGAGKDRSGSRAPAPASSKAEGSSPVKEEPVHVKEEPVDGPMDLDRSALPPASVEHERSASPAKLHPEGAEANREASSSGDAGPSPDRPPKLPHAHERRAPPTGPRGAKPWDRVQARAVAVP